jgi:hypothetical protein
MAYSLLGAHISSTVSGLPETIEKWKPPLVVLLDHSDVWHGVKAESPNTIFVGRLYMDPEPDFNNPSLDPVQSAHDLCDRILPWAERMGKTYDFWQGVNEPVISSPQAMQRYAAFDAERAQIMDSHGFRVVVGSFSVGNPQLPYWRDFVPALEAALQYHGALALHEYAWPTLDHNWPWYLLRHRKVYDGEPDHDWEGFPEHLKSLPLLITECGLDGLIEQGLQPRGWKVLYGNDPAEHLRQLRWYDTELLQDPYVAGAAIYCLATPDPRWKSYDIWPEVANTLAQAATPIFRLSKTRPTQPAEPTKPTEPTQPTAAAVAGWQMKVEMRPGPKIIGGSFPRAGIQLTVADPWGNATTVASGSKPGYGVGGFEVLAPNPASYTLSFLDQTFRIQMQDSSAIVTFTEVEPQPKPPEKPPEQPPEIPAEPPVEGAMLDAILERLDRIIELLRERL